MLPIVTSFTVAHSVTLIASAYGGVPAGEWFAPLVETLIGVPIATEQFSSVSGEAQTASTPDWRNGRWNLFEPLLRRSGRCAGCSLQFGGDVFAQIFLGDLADAGERETGHDL